MRMIEPAEDVQPNMEGRPSDEMPAGGILLENGGLATTVKRARIRGASVSVTDGPFTETKEMIGGFAFPTALSF